jgi:hypothetical protein
VLIRGPTAWNSLPDHRSWKTMKPPKNSAKRAKCLHFLRLFAAIPSILFIPFILSK